MDIQQRSYNTLDWPQILELITDNCALQATMDMVRGNPLATSHEEVQRRYSVVQEIWNIWAQDDDIPVAQVVDARDALWLIEQGQLLEIAEWVYVKEGLLSLRSLQRWLSLNFHHAVCLAGEIHEGNVDPVVVNVLQNSFDAYGDLSEKQYPILGVLRQKEQQLKQSIDDEVKRLLQDSNFTKNLQENYVTDRNGRIVFPMKNSYQKKIGVAHGTSRTGETIYVEPISVLPLVNGLQEVRSQLEHEIRAILRQLTVLVQPHVPDILKVYQGVFQIDLRRACALLKEKWNAVIPQVGTSGIIRLENMKHPLLLEKISVVGNDFSITTKQPVIMLSGPNAGGKTVALKSVGVATLLMKLGAPIPAMRSARVDFFANVFADIGDSQGVQEGLSSFSGHLLVLRHILERSSSNSLVLLDEIGMGTDPSQGSALAQAIIEQLMEQGARLVLTTHFTKLKALATTDSRFSIAAMHIVNGLPTYHLHWGEVGESEALALAKRMALPEILLWRARNLLDEQDRQIGNLVDQLELQRQEWSDKMAQLEFELAQAKRQQEIFERKNRSLEASVHTIKESARKDMERLLIEKEREANRLLTELRATQGAKEAKKLVTDIKHVRKSMETAVDMAEPIGDDVAISVGDIVDVRMLGCSATVQRILSGNKYETIANGFAVVVSRQDISAVRTPKNQVKHKNTVTVVRVPTEDPVEFVIRSQYNTCDVRGCRFDEAVRKVEFFFDQQVLANKKAVFILHGHGTGALKKGLREWLSSAKSVQSWRAAELSEGGDAFTVVTLQ